MPTHDELAQFLREYAALSPDAQEQFGWRGGLLLGRRQPIHQGEGRAMVIAASLISTPVTVAPKLAQLSVPSPSL